MISVEFEGAKKKKKWRKKGTNPTTGRIYYEEIESPKLKPGKTPQVPETPPPVRVPAQRPSGKWNPNIDISDQDWTNH